MTLKDLKTISLFQTASINEAIKDDKPTLDYVLRCLSLFYRGNYGSIDIEDTTANNLDLKEGYGHILARYDKAYKLTGDIYIEAHINKDADIHDIDYNNIMIMYCDER